MKHKVKALVEVEKNGLFGKKKVYEQRTVTVSGKEYKKIKRDEKKRQREHDPFSLENMMMYEAFFGDDD